MEFDSSLEVHGAILARLGEDSEDDDTKEYSNRFSARLFARTNNWSRYAVVSDTRGKERKADLKEAEPEMASMSLQVETTEDAPVISSVPSDSDNREEKIALQLQKRATGALEDAHESYDEVEESLATTTIERAQAQFDAADLHMEQGDEALAEEDYSSALESFTSAFRTAVQLEAFLDAQKRFKRNFISSKFDWGNGKDFRNDEDDEDEERNSDDDDENDENDEDDEDDKDKDDNDDSDDKEIKGFWGRNFFNR